MSNGKRVIRPLPWLKTRSQTALCSEYCKELVGFASSLTPNSAYDTARERMYLETEDMAITEELAKACRFLAMIRRDHGEEAFQMVISSPLEKRPRLISTDRKGAKAMSKVVRKEKRTDKTAKTPSLPLEHIKYRSTVNATFARVKCIQQFKNDAQNPVEAVYVFPMPDEATVIGCTMQIGKRKVEAELKKRAEAKKEYDEAVAAGHHASLLEQERPNIFTMNVGGIEPDEKINVEVDYVQRVPWQAGGGRFSIPLVVAPQFIPGQPTGRQASGWSPDTDEVPDASRITPVVAKEGVSYNADISVMFSPGFRCRISSPSHGSIITEQEVKKADTIELKTGDIRTDRDFVLIYKSLSKIPEVATHLGNFNGESFMLASIIPPGDMAPVDSDIVLVLDCSGSMSGAKIDGLKVIAKKVVNNLKKQNISHRLGIVPFDDRPWPEHSISEINESTEKFIDGLEARGGTCLGYALQKAESMLSSSQRPRVILMVTDGDTEHGKNWYGNGIRLIGVGIDTAVNDTRIKELTRRNNGTAEFVFPGEDYDTLANRMAGYISGPVLQNVKVKTEGDIVGVCDVFKGRPATIAVHFKNKPGIVSITGKDPTGKELCWDLDPKAANECDFAAQVWAKDYIRENQEEDKQTQVSLKYGVICRYTSFVAVSLKEVPGKKPERVEIPVNLPVGWDYEAVFGPSIKVLSLGAPRAKLCEMATLDAMGIEEESMAMAGQLDISYTVPKRPRRPFPSIPPMTPPQPITPTRFTFDAKDIVDRMIGILVVLSKGKRDEAEKAFAGVKRELTSKKANKLFETERAKIYYFTCRLTQYGLRLDSDVMTKLRVKPKSDSALAWYNLALKEEGYPFKITTPSGIEASEYIAWKFGKAERPQSGEWSLVP